jgi:hypothetical protein
MACLQKGGPSVMRFDRQLAGSEAEPRRAARAPSIAHRRYDLNSPDEAEKEKLAWVS